MNAGAQQVEEAFFLGVTRHHCDQTRVVDAIRELATNAVDADPQQSMPDVVRCGKDLTGGAQTATIVNKSVRPLVPNNLLQGPSHKKNQNQFFGGFGCGLKDAMAVLVREDVSMTITTPDWCGTVTERVRPSVSDVSCLKATHPEVCVLLRESSEADRQRLQSLMNGAAVAIELRDGSGKKLRQAVEGCKLGDLAKYSTAPMQLALPGSRGGWRLNPNAAPSNGNAGITLRGLYWADIPLPGCAALVFELRELTSSERNALGRDRRNFKLGVVLDAAVNAVQHLVANLTALPIALQDAVERAAQTPGLHNEIAKALGDLRPQQVHPQRALPAPAKKKKNKNKNCPECANKNFEIESLRKEIQQLRYLQSLPVAPPPRPTGAFLLPPNTTAGLTTWAQRNSLTAGAESSLAALLAQLEDTLIQLGFKDPIVTGSTARRTAVRGEIIDVDIAVWIPPSCRSPVNTTGIFNGSAFDTSDAFVFRPKDGNGLVVHCDLVHKSYRQHPIDVQFFPDQASHKAQLAFIDQLSSKTQGDHAALLAVGLKKWARSVLSVAEAEGGSNQKLQKVPGWVFEMIAVTALRKSANRHDSSAPELTPALFVNALALLQAPPREICMGCDVGAPAYRAIVAAAKATVPSYTA